MNSLLRALKAIYNISSDDGEDFFADGLLAAKLFGVLPNFHECFYNINSIETRKTCFLFLLEIHHDEKEENNLFTFIFKI